MRTGWVVAKDVVEALRRHAAYTERPAQRIVEEVLRRYLRRQGEL